MAPFLVLLLTSCDGPKSGKEPQAAASEGTPQQVMSTQHGSGLEERGESSAAQQRQVLGSVPNGEPKQMPSQYVWIDVGGQVHSADDLAGVAVRYLLAHEAHIDISKLRVDVFVRFGGGDVLADVVLSQGIGRPCWTISVDRKLGVSGCKKGQGVG